MEIAGMTLLGAFLLGLADAFDPTEDQAVVSLMVIGTARRLAHGILLVAIFGLGMAVTVTLLGLLASYTGVALLEQYETPAKIFAGLVTITFGVVLLVERRHSHSIHHHAGSGFLEVNPGRIRALPIFGFGLVRGLSPCPPLLAILAWAASVGEVLRGTLMAFLFGLGTIAGLIPLGLILGGVAGVARKTQYGRWIPKFSALAMIAIGLFLVLGALVGIGL